MVGVILIAAILFMPDGILPRLQKLWQRRARADAVRRGAAARSLAGRAGATRAAPIGGVLLQARGLAKSFRGVKALAGVDVEVRRGEILGLLGPNGSGKSTFINVVSGHYLPSGGSVLFEGQELAGRAGAPHRPRRHLAHLPDPAPVRAADACWTTWRWRRCSAAASPRRPRRDARRWAGWPSPDCRTRRCSGPMR